MQKIQLFFFSDENNSFNLGNYYDLKKLKFCFFNKWFDLSQIFIINYNPPVSQEETKFYDINKNNYISFNKLNIFKKLNMSKNYYSYPDIIFNISIDKNTNKNMIWFMSTIDTEKINKSFIFDSNTTYKEFCDKVLLPVIIDYIIHSDIADEQLIKDINDISSYLDSDTILLMINNNWNFELKNQ